MIKILFNRLQKKGLWIGWLCLTVILGVYLSNDLFHDKQGLFLSGKTTNAHYQIEEKCNLCHTPFQGVKEEACLQCHEDELKKANDSHKVKLFDDPRNEASLKIINAKSCLTCHREHQPEMTLAIGVTQPRDFCVKCHQEVAKERPSHRNLSFDTCSDCHNYHDNRGLYEDFLAKHLHEADTLPSDKAILPARNFLTFYQATAKHSLDALTLAQQDAPVSVDLAQAKDWDHSSHANSGVNCMMCHSQDQKTWVAKPDASFCQSCHEDQVKGFLGGKHGARLANKLPAMTTDKARLPMKEKPKTVNCMSCHPAHKFDTAPDIAGVTSCLTCHADEHSRAYKNSPHFKLWDKVKTGQLDKNAGVSCATCHLPRESRRFKGKKRIKVQHNQNDNLHPNSKMIRDVCLSCHGLSFTLDALADKNLIRNNFTGHPKTHLPSLEMVEKRNQTTPASH